jgi:DNA-directed RNA polymerase sigma subunit (sigma70/sigma32)
LLLNVSPVRVRQIEQRAFEKVRRELRRRYGVTAQDVKAITAR